jgi:hypothetical protein
VCYHFIFFITILPPFAAAFIDLPRLYFLFREGVNLINQLIDLFYVVEKLISESKIIVGCTIHVLQSSVGAKSSLHFRPEDLLSSVGALFLLYFIFDVFPSIRGFV